MQHGRQLDNSCGSTAACWCDRGDNRCALAPQNKTCSHQEYNFSGTKKGIKPGLTIRLASLASSGSHYLLATAGFHSGSYPAIWSKRHCSQRHYSQPLVFISSTPGPQLEDTPVIYHTALPCQGRHMLAEGLADAGLCVWFRDGPRHADAGRELVVQSNEASRFQGHVALANQKTTTNVEQSYLSIQLPSVRKFTQLCLPL